MAQFSRSVRVPYSPEQAFELVSGIREYPTFIKWITAMRVSDETLLAGGVRECLGEAAVGFKGFSERFTTRVTADPVARSVAASLVRGPFRKLHATWTIQPLEGGGCDIRLAIDYDFRNPFLGMLAAANHDLAVDRIMQSFLQEARRRYAAPSGDPLIA